MYKTTDALNMPEDPKKPAARGSNEDVSLEAVLATARKAMARGDGWDIEQAHYDRLRANCEALGISGNTQSITVALRDAFSEITADKLRRRHDQSYAGLESGQTLYDCRWQSKCFKRTLYLKFALNRERVEIFTFHEHREGHREVH